MGPDLLSKLINNTSRVNKRPGHANERAKHQLQHVGRRSGSQWRRSSIWAFGKRRGNLPPNPGEARRSAPANLAADMGRPDQRIDGRPVLAESGARNAITGENSDTRAGEVQTDMGRPDQPTCAEGGAGPTALGALDNKGNSSDTRLSACQTAAADMRRPGQEEWGSGLAGSTAPGASRSNCGYTQPANIETGPVNLMDGTGPTPPITDAGPARAGSSTQQHAPQTSDDPLVKLIESGAGRRRIATELNISEHEARKLLAERRNGGTSVHA
jgi:hypothetical protein